MKKFWFGVRAGGEGRRSKDQGGVRPRVEGMEDRLMPAVSAVTTVMHATAAVRAKTLSAEAAADWLNAIGTVVLRTKLPAEFVAQTAAQVAQGLSTQEAVNRLLQVPAARLGMSQIAFQFLLGRDLGQDPPVPYSRTFVGKGNLRTALIRVGAGKENWILSGRSPARYKVSLARVLLDRAALPPGLARRPVDTPARRLGLVRAVAKSQEFNRVWLDRLAQLALPKGTFPADVLKSAGKVIGKPTGLNDALAIFLGHPLSVGDVQTRALPLTSPPLAVGAVSDQYYLVNRQALVPDPVTDPPAYNQTPRLTGTAGVPMNSPWGKAAILPQVSYEAVMSGKAPQPTLAFSAGLGGSTPVASQTIQLWFQAKSPGALLSETVQIDGNSTLAPLIYINSSGKLAAGLFDQTPLPVIPDQTVLTWQEGSNRLGGESGTGRPSVGAANPVISQRTVVDNTWHHVALVVSGGTQALYLDGQLQGQVTPGMGSSYSYTPTLASGAIDLTGATFAVGGSITAQDITSPYPQINYPQGLIGSIDEVATWSVALTQAQVQQAVTAPISADTGLQAGLVSYFNFDQATTTGSWTDQVPGGTDTLAVPTSGAAIAQASTTIPTDPFTGAGITRLPGGRNWGIQVMTPLASPTVNLTAGATAVYKVGLAAGDQLQVSIPDGNPGTLTVAILDDAGNASTDTILGGDQKAIRALRTATYRITLTWTPKAPDVGPVDVTFGLIAGSLNSLVELFTSYKSTPAGSQAVQYQWAYADPTLPGVNPTAGFDAGSSAAAGYWPLWTDQRFFPVPSGIDPTAYATSLSAAYASLVRNSQSFSGGYANLINAAKSDPGDVQADLAASYTKIAGSAPPVAPGPFFPVEPADDPLLAVYKFFANANAIRESVYAVLVGSPDSTNNLVGWSQTVLDKFSAASSAAVGVATTIALGQNSQLQDINVSFPNTGNPTASQIIGEAAVWALGGALGAYFSTKEIDQPILGAILGGAGASILGSFIGEAGSPSNVGLTVPVQSIKDDIQNVAKLNDLASNISGAFKDKWTNIRAALTDPAFVQSILSNYGLITALQQMSGEPLGSAAALPGDVADKVLSRASWKTMVPAVFHWGPVSPSGLASGNGQTTNLNANVITQFTGKEPEGIAVGDFNGDGNLDMVVSDNDSNELSYLRGNGDGTFQPEIRLQLSGSKGPRGIVTGNFNGDQYPDIASANYGTNNVSILLGGPAGSDGSGFAKAVSQNLKNRDAITVKAVDLNGDGLDELVVANYSSDDLTLLTNFNASTSNYSTITTISLRDSSFSRSGPDGASGIAVGDYNRDGIPDLAVTNYRSSVLSLLWGQQDGSTYGFGPATTTSLKGGIKPQGIDTADLNGDGFLDLVVADTGSGTGDLRILYGTGTTSFSAPQVLELDAFVQPQDVLIQTVPGSRLPSIVMTWNRESQSEFGTNTSGMAIFYSTAPGQFAAPIYFQTNTVVFPGVAVGDFHGDGHTEIVIPARDGNQLTLFDPVDAGNFATFLPSNASPATLLGQVQQLQGGRSVFLGPYDLTGQVTPKTQYPLPYLADITLPFAPDQAALNVNAQGYFLSVTPASLRESQNGLSFQDDSALMGTAWTLIDNNNNPIATSTLQQLFGAPVPDPAAGPNATKGVDLAPVDPQNPFKAFNGGWYYDTYGAPSGYATWAESFFNWGLAYGQGYSQRNLVPYLQPSQGTGVLSGNLQSNASQTFGFSNAYTLTYFPAFASPVGAGLQVDLTSSFNLTGIAKDGVVLPNDGGLDGVGSAYSSTYLRGPVGWKDLLFRTGPTGSPNAIAAKGQTIDLPAGNFSKVSLLATGVNGDQNNQAFTVTFTDGNTYTGTLNLPDWSNNGSSDPSVVAATYPYRDNVKTGGSGNGSFNVYGFTLNYRSPKPVKSIILPNNSNVIVLGITMS